MVSDNPRPKESCCTDAGECPVRALVERVMQRIQQAEAAAEKAKAEPSKPSSTAGEQRESDSTDYQGQGVAGSGTTEFTRSSFAGSAAGGCFPDIDSAAEAAWEAHRALEAEPLDLRYKIIQAMRRMVLEHASELARLAVDETRLGRYEDKLSKIRLAAEKTPGPEFLQPQAYSGDRGLTLLERAPYGVIGAITPVTNPVATIVNNAIGMLAGGNAVVFNPHPSAVNTSLCTISLLNQAVAEAGGPQNLMCVAANPTVQTAQELMRHPRVRLLVVTGGPGVVRAAMQSGKKVIAAGPGNPPVVVDETADITKAAQDIVTGASFDNNIVCILEKEVFVVDGVAKVLVEELQRAGAYKINPWQTERLRQVLLAEDRGPGRPGMVNKRFVGRPAAEILAEVGIRVGDEVRLVIAEVAREHPFVWTEMLMPILPVVRVRDVDEAIELATAAEQGNGHTAVMHSRNIEKLSKMARVINTSIFVKNGPSLAGLGFYGEGYTSFSIASPTGEGLTTVRNFTRERRCTLVDAFRIV